MSQCDEGLLPRIQALKAEHPFWGYRRVWAYLQGVGEGVGWVYIVMVRDRYTKMVVGPYAGLRGTGQHWQEALDRAVNRPVPYGVRG